MKHRYLIILSLFLLQGFLFAQSSTSLPRLEPDPKAFEFARIERTRNYFWYEILDMALWASGTGYSKDGALLNEGAAARTAIFSAGESLPALKDLPAAKADQGDFLLNYMHQRFLKTYAERQTRLDLLVTTGRYNCVSSAVLYTILASAIGLESRGILTKDHAFVQVNTGTELVDVETTNPYGYNPGSKKEFHDRFGNTTGFAYVAPQNYRDRSVLTQLELVSLILTNRIADLESRGYFNEAVGLAVDKAALLSMRSNPSNSPFFMNPQKDVVDRVFNYGASLIKAGREEDALKWADLASPGYPDSRWQDFNYAAMNNLLLKMIQAKKVSDARIMLDMEASRFNPVNYNKLEVMVTEAELVQVTTLASTTEEAERALEIITRTEGRGLISAARITELRNFVLLKEAERRSKASGWQGAITYMESVINRYGSNPQLQNALKTYKSNRVIDLHNQFADLYNARKYEDARLFILNALQEFPGDRQLLSDQSMVEKALKQ